MRHARYEVEQELTRNAWFVLFRGRRREDGEPVLLKIRCTEASSALPEQLLADEHVFLRELALPGGAQVLERTQHHATSCLVYADPGGLPVPSLYASRQLDLATFFPRVIQCATILARCTSTPSWTSILPPGVYCCIQ